MKKDFFKETKKLQWNDVEKEDQLGRGVSQDVVVSLLKNISRKTFVRKPKKLQYNDDEKEEQEGSGVSQDIVVFLLKNISRKTIVREHKICNRMMMRRKSK